MSNQEFEQQYDTNSISGWMMTLISEKGIDPTAAIPAFEAVGHIGLSYQKLADFTQGMPMQMQNVIRHTLVRIDVMNGDVFDYLNHLMNGMIEALGLHHYAGFVQTKGGKAL